MGFEMFNWHGNYQMPYPMQSFFHPSQMPIPNVPEMKPEIQQSIPASRPASFEFTVVEEQINMDDLKERIQVKLVEEDLWERFKKDQLEMIITKNGRNLFPKLNFTVEGLEPDNSYLFAITFRRVGNEKYKFTKSEWVSAGHADEEFDQKEYPHVENARYPKGSEWMKSDISFAKLKLTNNQEQDKVKHGVVLRSMHKYCPVLMVYRLNSKAGTFDRLLEKEFTIATFIAVTAYQNQNVTKLKINNNPFAKGFREGGRKRAHPSEPSSPAKISPSAMLSPFMNSLSCYQNWFNPNALSHGINYYNQAIQAQNPIFASQPPMFPTAFGFQ